MIKAGAIQSLKELISYMEDPRDNRGKKHDFTEIIVLVIIGFLLGKTDFVNMEHCLKKELENLRKFLTLKNGIPSHDTFSRVLGMVDSEKLIFCICDWFGCLIPTKGRHLAIDGKGILAATKKNRNENTPYVVNVLETATKMVLMQLKVGEKTNEITTIPELLKYIDLKDVTVTIDAIGTQKEIVQLIVAKGGHYVLPVKENQYIMLQEIKQAMEDAITSKDSKIKIHEDSCQDHGRVEKRRYYVLQDNSCIQDKAFRSVKTIGKVSRKREVRKYDLEGHEKETIIGRQEVYYISDRELEAEEFAKLIRDHWKVEDSLHWVLDNTFREDRSTIRQGYATENTALMRKVAYNILRLHERKMSGHSMEYLIDEMRYNLETIINYICVPLKICH